MIGRVKEAANYFYIESAIALVISWIINTFVLAVFAKGFYGTAFENVGLENAGQYLGDTFGSSMKYIWAIGLLAAGMIASQSCKIRKEGISVHCSPKVTSNHAPS